MNRRTFLAGTGASALAGLAGCLRSRGSEDDFDVGMAWSDFDPEVVEVAVGETLVWRNTSNRAHTVTAVAAEIPEDAAYFASGGYESEDAADAGWEEGFGGAVRTGETYEHAFEVPGDYTYFCIPHEPMGMFGTVRVTE